MRSKPPFQENEVGSLVVPCCQLWLPCCHEVLEALRQAVRQAPNAQTQGPLGLEDALEAMQHLCMNSLHRKDYDQLRGVLPLGELRSIAQRVSLTLQTLLEKVGPPTDLSVLKLSCEKGHMLYRKDSTQLSEFLIRAKIYDLFSKVRGSTSKCAGHLWSPALAGVEHARIQHPSALDLPCQKDAHRLGEVSFRG